MMEKPKRKHSQNPGAQAWRTRLMGLIIIYMLCLLPIIFTSLPFIFLALLTIPAGIGILFFTNYLMRLVNRVEPLSPQVSKLLIILLGAVSIFFAGLLFFMPASSGIGTAFILLNYAERGLESIFSALWLATYIFSGVLALHVLRVLWDMTVPQLAQRKLKRKNNLATMDDAAAADDEARYDLLDDEAAQRLNEHE